MGSQVPSAFFVTNPSESPKLKLDERFALKPHSSANYNSNSPDQELTRVLVKAASDDRSPSEEL
jgi:hypothetical protein